MAASSVIPARRTVRADRGAIARAVARTAPRGPGLAKVVALPLRDDRIGGRADGRAEGPVVRDEHPAVPADMPGLRLVPPSRRHVARRGRGTVILAVAFLAVAVLLGAARGVLAQPGTPVASGHVVLAPGETLWDVAVRSAPAGVDPREQLEALRRLNGFGSAVLDAWTVVLIPAR